MDQMLLTPEQAAEALNISRTQTYLLMADGRLESVKIGKLRRIPAAAVQEFVEGLRAGSAA